MSRGAVDGELTTLRGESLAGLDHPGPASGLHGVWRQVEADAAAVLGGTTLAAPLSAEAGAGLGGKGTA
jgi:DNA-binding IscR family transcriptional regulator